ncbi:MAG: hypothetical protein NUV69_00730 [Candidatus Curtissbacteria bacterium]|nr:hypothetical protein [Candidatus Curtissbacteria bacterium]
MKEAVNPLPDIKNYLSRTLENEGFVFYDKPGADSSTGVPGRWLLRSEPASRLKTSDYVLNPQTGQNASYGVFLANSFAALPIHPDCAFYLFERDLLSTVWLTIGSADWNEKIKKVCEEKGLNPASISGYDVAERTLYEQNATFSPRTDICTVPRCVEAVEAVKVYIPPSAESITESIWWGVRGKLGKVA